MGLYRLDCFLPWPKKKEPAAEKEMSNIKSDMNDIFWKVFPVVLGAFLACILGLIAFSRQRKVGAMDSFKIFIETKKIEIPDRNGFLEFQIGLKKEILVEYAKLTPFLSRRKKSAFQKIWTGFCEIKADDLQDKYEDEWKGDLRISLGSKTVPERPSDILRSHLEKLIKAAS
jgi:hypothetical protein